METSTTMTRNEPLPVLRMDPRAKLPARAHDDDAGMDLHALDDVEIGPGQGVMVRTGVAVALRKGVVGLIADRSSLAKKGLKTAGGVIDAGYRGEIQVVMWNLSREAHALRAGDRVAQLLILPIETPRPIEAETLDATARGAGGFGSTGA